MNPLFCALDALLQSGIAPGDYCSPCGLEMLYVGMVVPVDVEHINFRGHIFLLD